MRGPGPKPGANQRSERHMSKNEYRQATPKKLPGGQGWGVQTGPGATVDETVEVTTRRGKVWLATLVEEIQPGVWSTDTTEPTLGRTRERLENRADKRDEWAESRMQKADQAWDDSRKAVEGIPLGQPILVGHHSERGHRRAIKRAQDKATESVEHLGMANRHSTAADTIRRNLGRSIYDDDPDAIEALTEKLAALEYQRERIKGLNLRIRKGEPLDDLGLTDEERHSLQYAAQWHGQKTFPPYVLQNLGGNITRTRQRLERIKKARNRMETPE